MRSWMSLDPRKGEKIVRSQTNSQIRRSLLFLNHSYQISTSHLKSNFSCRCITLRARKVLRITFRQHCQFTECFPDQLDYKNNSLLCKLQTRRPFSTNSIAASSYACRRRTANKHRRRRTADGATATRRTASENGPMAAADKQQSTAPRATATQQPNNNGNQTTT